MLPDEVRNSGGDMAADRHCSWGGEITSSAATLKQGERAGSGTRLDTLKAAPSDTCLPAGLHLLTLRNLLKQRHQPGTKCSNM